MKKVHFNGNSYTGTIEEIIKDITCLQGREEVEAAVRAVAEVYPEIAEVVFGIRENDHNTYKHVVDKYWDCITGSLAEHINALCYCYHYGADLPGTVDEEFEDAKNKAIEIFGEDFVENFTEYFDKHEDFTVNEIISELNNICDRQYGLYVCVADTSENRAKYNRDECYVFETEVNGSDVLIARNRLA